VLRRNRTGTSEGYPQLQRFVSDRERQRIGRVAVDQKKETRMVATISREDLQSKLDRGDDFFLVETLSEEQYRHTHLPGAVNLPPDAVRESAPELLPNKDADIVVYCAKPD
jgi:hypothetical protein